MGCAASTRNLDGPEVVLTKAEEDSGLQQLSAKHVDFTLRKRAIGGVISGDELRKVMLEFQLPYLASKPVLFAGLERNSNSCLTPVLVTFLLLSTAHDSAEKLELIFEVFDPQTTGHLREKQLKELVRTLLLAGCKFAPSVVSSLKGNKNREVRSYLKAMQAKIEPMAAHLTKKILNGRPSVTLSQFLAGLSAAGDEDLSKCVGIRELLQRATLKKATGPQHNTV